VTAGVAPPADRAGAPVAAWLGAVLLLAAVALAVTMALRSPWHFGPGAVAVSGEMAAVAAALDAAAAAPRNAEARRDELMQLVARDPDNGRAWALLGFIEAEAGRYAASADAFEKALARSRRVALDPAVWCEYADALGMAQGTLAGRPTEAILKALALRPGHPKALEMAGSAAYERRDFAAAVQYWRSLLAQLQAGTQPHGELSAAIERGERLAATSLPPPR
jgi:cytochrome c-type biogenesis protein CcmH